MGLPRTQVETPLPACAACGQLAATNGFWDHWLCDACQDAWVREAPHMGDLEWEHAQAHPKDVQQRGTYQFHDAARARQDWVLLTHAASVHVARSAATKWLLERRQQQRKLKAVPAETRP